MFTSQNNKEEKIKSDVIFSKYLGKFRNLCKILGQQGSSLNGEKCLSFRVEVLKRYGSYMRVSTAFDINVYEASTVSPYSHKSKMERIMETGNRCTVFSCRSLWVRTSELQ